MTYGTSLFLIAVGAILKFAVTDKIADVDLATVGVILMVIGGIGFLLSLLYATRRRDAVVVERDGVAPAEREGVPPRTRRW